MLTQEQIDFFRENGFIRLEQVYPPDELQQMSDELDAETVGATRRVAPTFPPIFSLKGGVITSTA